MSGWRNPVHGADALIVGDGGHILLAGGFGPERDRLVEGRLTGRELAVIKESRLILPNGEDLPPRAVMTGRGPYLFVFAGRDCYRMTHV